MKSYTDQFTDLLEDYLKSSGMTATRFGVEAMGSPSYVWRLREGSRSTTLRTADRVRQYILDHPVELK